MPVPGITCVVVRLREGIAKAMRKPDELHSFNGPIQGVGQASVLL